MKQRVRWYGPIARASIAGLLLCVICLWPVSAQENAAITQAFPASDANIVAASMVAFADSTAQTVELASADAPDRLAGIASVKALVELGEGSNTIQVVTSGLAMTLVSDINGPVTAGDKIAASPIKGVGMKATQSGVVIGTAQGTLAKVEREKRTITAKNGNKKTVSIGLLPVQVAVAFYTMPSAEGSSYIPPYLQDLANRLTGKDVPPVRVLIAAAIFLLLFVSITVLLYAAVRSSITSIGRNPLSQSAVRKSLAEVGVTIIAVLIFAIVTIYLVLTL